MCQDQGGIGPVKEEDQGKNRTRVRIGLEQDRARAGWDQGNDRTWVG